MTHDPDDDWAGEEAHTDPTFVLGAVLAQLEDLELPARIEVLSAALAQCEDDLTLTDWSTDS